MNDKRLREKIMEALYRQKAKQEGHEDVEIIVYEVETAEEQAS